MLPRNINCILYHILIVVHTINTNKRRVYSTSLLNVCY